jgi:tetratricopeptide (TPR) repeat protein
MKLNTTQYVVICSALILIALLIYLPRTLQNQTATRDIAKADVNDSKCFDNYIDSTTKLLAPDFKLKLQTLASTPDYAIRYATSKGQSLIAVNIAIKAYSNSTDVASIKKLAGRYYNATKFANADACVSTYCYTKAVEGFNKVLVINKNDLEAKTLLGSCYVEMSQNPMQGITLLREVVTTDSTYVDAHLRLAMFAVQSKQYDKAIARFEKILKINPKFSEAYLYIGEVYASMGNKSMAISNLQKFKEKSNDALVINEVDKYIRQLK